MESDVASDKARVLVVENDPHLQGALRSSAQAAGAAAVGVGTLRAAREELGGRGFAGMILGASLPDGSGISLLEDLRTRQFHLHVLVISNGFDPTVANRAHRLGASCVFTPDIAMNVRAFVHRSVGSTAEKVMAMSAGSREGMPPR